MGVEKPGLTEELERLDTAMRGLSGEIAGLEERVKSGDKGAYRTCKYQRLQLAKLRQERSEVERRMRRLGMPI